MLLADKSGDETNYLYGKACENARRVALVLAVSRAGNPLRAAVGAREAEYATGLVDYLIATVMDCIRETLAENENEKYKKRILKILALAGAEGLTRNELTRKTQFIRRALREEYLDDLVEAGQIRNLRQNEGQAYGERFVLAEFSEPAV